MTWKLKATIAATLLAALVLTVIPMPKWISSWRPDWLAMAAIWWNIHRPGTFNVGSSWASGLLLDVLNATWLGQHALALTITSYFAVRINLQFKMFSLIQQTLLALAIMSLYRILLFWLYSLAGVDVSAASHWNPLLAELLLWPWLSFVLGEVIRHSAEEKS